MPLLPIGIVACSGASNTGNYSDLVARELVKSGYTKMLCLARFSIDDDFANKSKNEYSKFIVLDGCPINCAEKILEQKQIVNVYHINVTDFGIIKGQTAINEEKVKEIVNYIINLN